MQIEKSYSKLLVENRFEARLISFNIVIGDENR